MTPYDILFHFWIVLRRFVAMVFGRREQRANVGRVFSLADKPAAIARLCMFAPIRRLCLSDPLFQSKRKPDKPPPIIYRGLETCLAHWADSLAYSSPVCSAVAGPPPNIRVVARNMYLRRNGSCSSPGFFLQEK